MGEQHTRREFVLPLSRRRGATEGDAGSADLRHQVRLARDGDPDAWERLYRRFYPGLYSYARRRVPSATAAEDAVSETMKRAIGSIGRFRWRGGGYGAWLYGILRNVVHEGQRVDARAQPVGELPETLPEVSDDPADEMEASTRRELLRAAFSRLSPEDQELLELRVVARLSAAEVARVVGKRPGAVRTAQSRAVARLRSLWEEVDRD